MEEDLIRVTPSPTLPRFQGTHDGVVGGVEVFPRMLVWRRVTTAHMTTLHANPQVDPSIPVSQALLAASRSRRHRPQTLSMRAIDSVWNLEVDRGLGVDGLPGPPVQVLKSGVHRSRAPVFG